MRVLITGATGLIGQEIIKHCNEQEIDVNYLTTSKSKINQSVKTKGFYWNPKHNEIDTNCFKDVDAIIHLAGATVSKRWTRTYKKEILESRKITTQLLFDSLENITHQVKHVISASAIGIYPDSLINYYDESNKEVSASFLGSVVKNWEHEVDQFSKLNISVSKIRIGLVLSNKGGALLEITKPVKLGLGAAFGAGNQWQSWIHITDLAQLFLFVLKNKLEGVYNGVAPNPVTNQELTKNIANTLERPLFLPNIPKFFMKLVLGEMHVLLFESQRVCCKKVEDLGFEFEYHHLQPALDDLLKEIE
jgi:uncharacterized protein